MTCVPYDLMFPLHSVPLLIPPQSQFVKVCIRIPVATLLSSHNMGNSKKRHWSERARLCQAAQMASTAPTWGYETMYMGCTCHQQCLGERIVGEASAKCALLRCRWWWSSDQHTARAGRCFPFFRYAQILSVRVMYMSTLALFRTLASTPFTRVVPALAVSDQRQF